MGMGMTIWEKLSTAPEDPATGQAEESAACECECATLPVHVRAFLDERDDGAD
jgi:hypothetical protein